VPRNVAGGKSCDWDGADWPDLDWLRARYENGDYRIMGEMLFVYAGVAPDDARMAPYWALAEELDIPVGVHISRGPPLGAPPRGEGCCPDFNSDLGDPSLLAPVLERHPNLRIWLQHAGIPGIPPTGDIDYNDQTIAILKTYPNVYVDFSILNSVFDPESHEAALRRFIAEGLIDRVMFGADNMPADEIIARLEGFDFLTDAQRRGIYYDNAARFLRLDAATIEAHHRR
jgi:predicted TIM-barrel fold metal-dependent hydrolase